MTAINTNKLRATATKAARQSAGALAAIFGIANTWSAKQTFSDYTALGDASIKIKKVTGTTDALAAGVATVAHGVTLAKIISLWVGVNDGTTLYAPSSDVAANLFTYTADATNVTVTNGALATTILSQPFTATIIYEE
jgi:hypothetical protein